MKILTVVLAINFYIVLCIAVGHGQASLIGGFRTQDLTKLSPEEKQRILDAVNVAIAYMNDFKTDHGRNNQNGLVFKKLIEVQTQVVAGIKYIIVYEVYADGKIQICKSIVSHLYPWQKDGGKWIVQSGSPNDECDIYFSTEKTSRQSRSLPLLGGKKPLDNSDKQLLEAAQWAVEHLNRMSNSLYQKALMKISNGTKQVVNGYHYEFMVTVTPTICRNNEENVRKTLTECPASNDAKPQECDVSVFLSEGKYKMDSFNCRPVPDAPAIGGGDHDYKPHGMIGGGDHDYKPHGMIGGGEHDHMLHRMMGRGHHNHMGHGMIGGGDHDYKPHGMIGGGDHDYKPHGMIGGGDHDYKPHGNSILGQDTHDYISHKPNEQALNNLRDAIMQFGTGIQKSENVNVHQMTITEDKNLDTIASIDDFCSQYKADFEKFKASYNKVYSSEAEESQRFQVFCKNMEKVKVIQKAEQGSGQYGATIFADISEEEFKKHYLGFKPTKTSTQWPMAQIPSDPIPDSWDWRDHGAVSPVKNQGSCGSCWAFSTTGNVEGQWAVNGPSHQLLSLSEQELVDCDKLDEGCGGGYMYQAYEAILNIGGLETEADYKYEGKDDKCRFNKSEVVVKVTGALNISQDENEMASWLYKNGPIAIGINAFAMQFYMGGISHPWKLFCSPDGLDHGVLIVGYGKKGNEPYWIVKNSWGPSWGIKGYYLVYRGDGTCGLNKMCSSATVN